MTKNVVKYIVAFGIFVLLALLVAVGILNAILGDQRPTFIPPLTDRMTLTVPKIGMKEERVYTGKVDDKQALKKYGLVYANNKAFPWAWNDKANVYIVVNHKRFKDLGTVGLGQTFYIIDSQQTRCTYQVYKKFQSGFDEHWTPKRVKERTVVTLRDNQSGWTVRGVLIDINTKDAY